MKRLHTQLGMSTIEYSVMIALIIGGLVIMSMYVGRAMSGRWQSTGGVFGFGRQYDANHTVECAFDGEFLNVWYDKLCYDGEVSTSRCWTLADEVGKDCASDETINEEGCARSQCFREAVSRCSGSALGEGEVSDGTERFSICNGVAVEERFQTELD